MEAFINENVTNLTITLLLVIIYFISLKYIKHSIDLFEKKRGLKTRRSLYLKKISRLLISFLLLVSLAIIWGINYNVIVLFTTTFFTVVGVALFATWSILSNITSSIIIFTSCPFKIEDEVKILDGDNTFEGRIIDITLFNLVLRDKSNNIITYPNNVILQKAVIKKATS